MLDENTIVKLKAVLYERGLNLMREALREGNEEKYHQSMIMAGQVATLEAVLGNIPEERLSA